MKTQKTKYTQFFFLLAFFYICWTLPQVVENMRQPFDWISPVLYCILFAVVAGTLLPLEYARKWLREFPVGKGNLFLSVLSVVPALFFIAVLAGYLPPILATLHPIPLYILYALLAFCTTFGLWVFAFFILPRLIPRAVAYIVFTAVFFGFGFLLSSAFSNILLSLEMFIVGLLLAIAQIYHNRPWLSFVSLYAIVASFMLVRQQYNHFPLWLVSAASALMLLVIFSQRRCLFAPSRRRKTPSDRSD